MTDNNQATAPVTLSDKEILDLLASILLSIPQEHLGRAVLEGAFYPFDKAFAASTIRFDPKDYTFTPEELKEIDPRQFHNDLFVQSVVCLAVAGVLFTEIFEMAAGAPVPETAVIDWMVDWLPEKKHQHRFRREIPRSRQRIRHGRGGFAGRGCPDGEKGGREFLFLPGHPRS